MMKVILVLVTLASLPSLQVDATFGPFRLSSSSESDLNNAQVEYLRGQYERPKRSGHGSGDILYSLKNKIGQGIKTKLGHLGKASASASGHFVHKASGHLYPAEDNKGFDIFAFKKSVLYTLLQAIKAIKGGVVAIKGQLIKGGGQLLTAKGHILRGGGEALTELGKSIATSAFMIIPHAVTSGDHETENYEYAHPSSYGHTGGEVHHGHPTGPSGPSAPEYGPTGGYHHKYNSVYDGKPPGHRHDGIVILKKAKQPRQRYTEHEGQETQTSDFRPMTDPPPVGPEKHAPLSYAQDYHYPYAPEPPKLDYFQYVSEPLAVDSKPPSTGGGSIFVTPTPEMQEEHDQSNVYINMNFPYPIRTSANYAQPPSPTQFLIDYPDSKESYSEYPRVTRQSRPKKGPTRRPKRQPSKYIRSFAYRPDDPTTTY